MVEKHEELLSSTLLAARVPVDRRSLYSSFIKNLSQGITLEHYKWKDKQ